MYSVCAFGVCGVFDSFLGRVMSVVVNVVSCVSLNMPDYCHVTVSRENLHIPLICICHNIAFMEIQSSLLRSSPSYVGRGGESEVLEGVIKVGIILHLEQQSKPYLLHSGPVC